MSKGKKVAVATLALFATGIALTDLGFLLDDVEGNTYSSIIRETEWIAGGIGFAAIHAVRKTNVKPIIEGWWGVAAGAALSVSSSYVIGGGVPGMLLGGAVGWLLWQNDGKS